MSRSCLSHRRYESILFSDTFNRADQTLALTQTNGKGICDPIFWTNINGTQTILSNEVAANTNGPTSPLICVVGVNNSRIPADIDITFTCTKMPSSGLQGIIFRDSTGNYAVSQRNCYAVLCNSAGAVLLRKYVNNATTDVIAAVSGGGDGSIYRIVAKGSSFQLFRDGASIGTGTDSFNNTVKDHVNLVFNLEARGRIDNVIVRFAV